MGILMTNKKAALSSALALVMAGLSSPGHAMEFKVSGQVNRAITVADNGNETDYSSVDSIGSNSRFRFTGNEKMANGVFNAVGRQERIRYDSPSIGGLVLSTSLDNGNAYELAARYHVDFPGAKLASGLSWVDANDLEIPTSPADGQPLTPGSEFKKRQVLGASASLLLDGGLNFTVSYGNGKTDAMANAGRH